MLSRRYLLAGGASLGVLALFGCDQAAPPEAAAQAQPSGRGAGDGDIAMHDGSQVEPLSSEGIMNPDGLRDRPIGGANATVTVIEYASPTCPHCAAFHNEIYPAFKERYLDSGDVRFIVRPFRRNVLDSAVFMLAEAAGAEGYHNVLETYFRTQDQWAFAENPGDAIKAIALELGFTEESYQAALTNQEVYEGIESVREQAIDDFAVQGTPTFYINGEKLTGEYSLENLAARIDPLLS